MHVLTVSDLHSPFHHPAALDFLSDLRRLVKPDVVVCLGDEVDGHGWSRHDRNPDAPGQRDELAAARVFLACLAKLFKRMKVCRSNHGERAARKIIRAGLPSAFLRDMRDVLGAPATWEWADRHIVDGVLYKHGEGFSGQNSALAAAQAARYRTVIGHVHSWAGIQYHRGEVDTVWGMNVGCLVDVDSLAMAYAKHSKNKQVIGTGAVLNGVPQFFPLLET